MGAAAQSPRPLRVMVYSDDKTVRRAVLNALGTRPAVDLPELEFIEVATGPMAVRVSRRTVERLCHDGKLLYLKVNRALRVTVAALLHFIKANEVGV